MLRAMDNTELPSTYQPTSAPPWPEATLYSDAVGLRVLLLGPLCVFDGERSVVLAPGKQRVLLASLALAGNRVVPLDELAEVMWNGDPPRAAEATLRNHVSRLRQTLGPTATTRLETSARGYLLTLAEEELDTAAFEARCRAAFVLPANDRARRHAALTAALDLWRGRPLADIDAQLLRDAYLPHLDQLRLEALEARIEADLHLAAGTDLITELRDLVREHPLRERLHAHLMVALDRQGRRAEALEAYQSARRLLITELGVEPGVELRRLHARILAGDQEPDSPAAVVHKVPAEQGDDLVPRQLPAAARYFTGRQTELHRLTSLLDQPACPAASAGTVLISAIDGMAGIGKTALAVHAAQHLSDHFPDGQLFIDLHACTKGCPPREPGDALEVFLRRLGISAQQIPQDAEERAALYRQRLADTRTLIVLDNASDEAQVRPLLPGAPGCLVLVTSRRRLKGLDEALVLSLDVLPPREAVALLRAVAGPGRVAAADPLLAEIAQLCGHLPLALRIAGALLRHRAAWGLEHLAGLLRDQRRRVKVLSDGERDLGAVFDLSYTGLGVWHRLLFRRLGLVPGPDADAYAAAALLERDPQAASGLLEDLVDHNLLIQDTPGRYRLHDLLRVHARALVFADPQPERVRALDRLLHYYAHTAQSASLQIARYPRDVPHGPVPDHAPAFSGPEDSRAWLGAQRPNLEAAHAHACAHDLDDHAVALAAGLAEILRVDGLFSRAVGLHQAAAETAGRIGRPAACAAALTELGRALHMAADYRAADEVHGRALEIYREIGDQTGAAAALIGLGRTRYLVTDIGGAGRVFAQALEIYRALGHRPGQAAALTELGRVRRVAGDYPAAGHAHTQALEIYREAGSRLGEATALHDLGEARRVAGDLSGAGDAYDGALEIVRALGHRQYEASLLTCLGIVRSRTGDHGAAGDLLPRALEIFREIGAHGDEAWTLNHYAAALAAAGDRDRAHALYRQALAMNRELNKPDDEALSLEGIADHHLHTGNPGQGVAHLHQALEIHQRLGMQPGTERVQALLAEVTDP